ncbi:hypothetical protein ACHHV8_36715 [Paenibacillus sp. TAB 01]|uniref:hypothetical protein n=1 Tax=Paenibacillus sp. TAB 01 TaxID=3368988 RepID=UPI003750A9DA
MAYYLQMPGNGSYIKLPSMTLSRIVAEVAVRRKTDVVRVLWDFRTGISFAYLIQQINGTDAIGAGAIKVSGTSVSNGTTFIPENTKTTIEHTFSSTAMDDGNIFSNSSGAANSTIDGDIYDIKLYNGTTLVAHYDMSTGTVQDQTGNGNHATLIGGSWVQDGPVGDAGTVNYATKQVITQSGSVAVSTKQIVSQIGADSYATGQTIYQPQTTNAPTKQAIYAIGSVSYSTLQVITQDGIPGVISYATRQSIYSSGAAAYPTKQVIVRQGTDQHPTRQSIYSPGVIQLPARQSIYRIGVDPSDTRQIIYKSGADMIPVKLAIFQTGSLDLPTLQIVFDEQNLIVSRVALQADRVLRVSLLASRELRIELGGDLQTVKKNQNFEMERGESKYLDFSVAGIDDFTSASVMWAMRKGNASEPALLKDTVGGIEITGSERFTVSLTTADTENFPPGIYYHEAYVIDAQQHKSPVASGIITLTLGLI